MIASKPIELTFIYRSGCHLCDVMWEELETFRASPSIHIKQLDLGRERGLEAQYGTLIPVLLHADHEICHYFLDSEKLTSYLQRQRTCGVIGCAELAKRIAKN